MSSLNNATDMDAELLGRLSLALMEASIGAKQKKQTDFANAYEIIELHLSRKVPQRQVMRTFSETYGHTLHPPQFRKMLDAERRRRSEVGEPAACAACGQVIAPDVNNAGTDEFEDAA